MRRILNFLIVLLFCCFPTGELLPYDSDDELLYGEISGRIIDTQSKAPLPNVNIMILDSNYGAASAMDGTYLIRKIPPGKYALKISCVGYRPMVVNKLRVKPGRLTVKNIQLESTIIELDEVIMTASRREQTAQGTPASVSVIKSSDIEQSNAATFDQALETVPGISIQRSIGVSVQSLSLRGSSDVAGGGVGNRVMLAIDGRPALSSDSGGALWSLVPTNFIERIEVVKGAFSSLYGSTAMGGVINVITKMPTSRNYFKVNVKSGFHETPPESIQHRSSPSFFNTLEFNHSRKLGKLSYLLSLSRKESDGHRQRSAYEFYNLYGKLFFDFSNNRNLEVTLGSDIGRNDYPHTWYKPAEPAPVEPLKVAPKNRDNVQRKNTFSADVHYYAIPNPRVKYSSRFFFYRQVFKSTFNQNDPEQLVQNNEPFGLFIRSDSRKIGNITQLDYSLSSRNYLTAGIDIQRDMIDSIPDTILYGKRQVNNFAVYFQDEHELTEALTFNFGARYDFNKLEGGRQLTHFSPKIALIYAPVQSWSLRFLAGGGFRAPSIAERFFREEIAGGTRFRPNPDLRAETVTSFEVGSRVRLGDLADLDLALFRNTYDDMIYWINLTEEEGVVAEGGGFLYQVQNLNKAVIQGSEFSINLHPWRFFDASLNYTYLDAKDKSDIRRFGALAYKVKHAFNFKSSLRMDLWEFNLHGRYNSKVEQVFLYPSDRPDAFFVLNGKVVRRQFGQHFDFSLGVNNIFNKQYEELARYRMPGRHWIFGMSYEF